MNALFERNDMPALVGIRDIQHGHPGVRHVAGVRGAALSRGALARLDRLFAEAPSADSTAELRAQRDAR